MSLFKSKEKIAQLERHVNTCEEARQRLVEEKKDLEAQLQEATRSSARLKIARTKLEEDNYKLQQKNIELIQEVWKLESTLKGLSLRFYERSPVFLPNPALGSTVTSLEEYRSLPLGSIVSFSNAEEYEDGNPWIKRWTVGPIEQLWWTVSDSDAFTSEHLAGTPMTVLRIGWK